MTDYNPSYAGTVTRYVVVESFTVTPSDVAIRAYEVAKGVMIKENCFGLVIMGKEDDVNRVIAEVRKMDPAHIFVKDRGFPPGDARRCRATLGGARPGFHGIEFEMTILPYVSRGLETLDTREAATVPAPQSLQNAPRLDVYRLKKMIDAQEP
ncbi:methanogenesis marker 6 protein [Methanoregula sp.]|uniref:methanogenesis marker 6 protein n=1 Tax=Methanoregula sp. TaxID=2052170 RepID=UPI002CAFA9DF|nr:methanogenesis marker 6 protein [Methanoregula sp.]HVP95666.1 methanogenesis marker 6 protein [Methanoregula sp.]